MTQALTVNPAGRGSFPAWVSGSGRERGRAAVADFSGVATDTTTSLSLPPQNSQY